jgi:hypothetical protein
MCAKERQNMEANMRELRSLMWYSVKKKWEKGDYIEIRTLEERKGIMGW